jgi:glucose-1-phosphate thymidylyltransferase
MLGIILGGGKGTRMFPFNKIISKHLLPIYDKPLIYYSISTLMLLGIRKILIVVDKSSLSDYKNLLGDGKKFGISIKFICQNKPKGIVHALSLCKNEIKKQHFVLYLGDNIFYGHGLIEIFNKAKNILKDYSSIFTHQTEFPKNFGILYKNKNQEPTKIVEKPKSEKNNEAVTGIYFYNNQVLKLLDKITYSKRRELEITDLNNLLLKQKKLKYFELGRGIIWHDCGSITEMLNISHLFYMIEKRQNFKVYCPEEISLKNKWISKKQLSKNFKKLKDSSYKEYILSLI